MAEFLFHSCEYPRCNERFRTQHELIVHVELRHVDFSEAAIERAVRTGFVSMSNVIRYTPANYELEDGIKQETISFQTIDIDPCIVKDERKPIISYDSSTLLDSDLDKNRNKKRYLCPVKGCSKRYKNLNGMQYHVKNVHDMNGLREKMWKEYKCAHCSREYKTIRGLQSHITTSHRESCDAILPNSPLPMHVSESTMSPFMYQRRLEYTRPEDICFGTQPIEGNLFSEMNPYLLSWREPQLSPGNHINCFPDLF